MKNGLLQIIKKFNLAVTLAKNDSLGVLDNLRSFNGIRGLVNLFYRSQLPEPESNIHYYLKFSQDAALLAVYDELSARSDLFGDDFRPIGCEEKTILNDEAFSVFAIDDDTAEFYSDLATEIVHTDYPELTEELTTFNRRMEKLSDMRLYGAEVEDFNEILKKIESAFPLNIDWGQTGKGNLSLDIAESLIISSQLSATAQENLLQTVAQLFFEYSVFVSSFRAIYTNHASRINFYGFDRVYAVDPALQEYCLDYIYSRTAPTKFLEYKLVRLFRLLEFYCPECDVLGFFRQFSSENSQEEIVLSEESEPEAQKKTLNLFHEQQFAFTSPVDSTSISSADSFKRHLLKENFKKETRFAKTPFLYFIPLLILIYALLKMFS